GTVTNQDIADVVREQAGQDIDKRNVTIPDIHQLGNYQVEIKLHPEVTATVEIEVAPL
ncbi:MAG: 50S ribosomal protein L9, partial [Kamptonema sp. SIO4C4]|nr:50S ribosomal protein L9 [Kamptonema sp. SIO4C4]